MEKSKFFTRTLAVVLAAVMLAAVLCGCGGGSNSGDATKPTGNVKKTDAASNGGSQYPAEGEVHNDFYDDIKGSTIWIMDDPSDESKEIAAAFEKEYGVTFKWEDTTNGWDTRIAQQITSGKSCDLIGVWDNAFISNVLSGTIVPIDQYIEAGDPAWNWDLMNLHMYKGKHYGVVSALRRLDFDDYVWYNKTMFEDAGQTDPYTLYKQGNWNFETFLSTAKAMTQKAADGSTSVYGYNGDLQESFLQMNGNPQVSFDNKNGKATITLDQTSGVNALKLLQELYKNKYSNPDVDYVSSFFAGKTAMTISNVDLTFNQGAYEKCQFELGWAPTPKGSDTGDTYYRSTRMWSYATTSKAQNPKGGIAYMDFYGRYQKLHENDPEMKAARDKTYSPEHYKMIQEWTANSKPMNTFVDGIGNWGKGKKYKFWNAIKYDLTPPATVMDTYLPELQGEIDYAFSSNSITD